MICQVGRESSRGRAYDYVCEMGGLYPNKVYRARFVDRHVPGTLASWGYWSIEEGNPADFCSVCGLTDCQQH